MISFKRKLQSIQSSIDSGQVKIMIIGLGSVGLYLLDYIISKNDPMVDVVVVGRNNEKMQSDVNIIKIATTIRDCNKSQIIIDSNCNLENVESIEECIARHQPDIIVNSSRVFVGLKYGSISWDNLRSYGIWTPLAVKFIRNIMVACKNIKSNAIVINTSYSDVVNPWLKNSNNPYPDFGSGNLNHLTPRIKHVMAEMYNIKDFWNIDVTLATSHFHDVLISKEGQTDGVQQLLDIKYCGKTININQDLVFNKCNILMPTDAKRNMMNASSNYEIIFSIIDAIKQKKRVKFHSPGVFGEIGGYPFIIDARKGNVRGFIDESVFSLEKMREKNLESIAMDGIENIIGEKLIYTAKLIENVNKIFNIKLPKIVHFKDINDMSEFIIDNIIKKYRKGDGDGL